MNLRRLRGTVVANVGLTVLALICAGLVPLVFNLVVGRHYGADQLGEVSVVLSLTLLLGQVPGTLGAAVTKFVAEAMGRKDQVTARAIFQFLFVLNLGVALLLAAVLLLATPLVKSAFHISSTGAVVLGASLVVTYALYIFLKSVYYGVQRADIYVRNEFLSDVAFFLLLAAILLFNGQNWLLVPFVLNNLIFAAIGLRDLSSLFEGFSWRRVRPAPSILRYSIVTGGGTVASLSRASLVLPIAGLYLVHADIGWLAAALSLTAPLALMPRALSLVLFADMARLYGAGEAASVRRLLQNSTEWLIFLLGLLCGLVIINAGTIIGLLFQPEYRQATMAMQLIVLSAYITMVSNPAIDALSSTQYIRIPTIASWLALTVSLGSWFLLIPSLGINGAAAGYLAGAIVSGGMPTLFAYRRYHMSAIMFLRAAVIFGALIIAMLVPEHFQPITSALFAVLVCALYARTGRSGLQQLIAKYGHGGWRRSKASVPPP